MVPCTVEIYPCPQDRPLLGSFGATNMIIKAPLSKGNFPVHNKIMYKFSSFSGLFLVAYYTLLVVVCVPVAFIQLKLGSILRRGVLGIFAHFMPALKGKIYRLWQNAPIKDNH